MGKHCREDLVIKILCAHVQPKGEKSGINSLATRDFPIIHFNENAILGSPKSELSFWAGDHQKFNPLSGDTSGISSSSFKSSLLEFLKLPYAASLPETFSGTLRLRSSTSLVVA